MIKELDEIDFVNAPWTEVDAAIVGYDAKQASRDYWLGRAVLQVDQREIWRSAGFASFVNYFEVRLGWDPHTTMERRRTALALESLPLLSTEMREGRMRYCKVREITRVADADVEKDWIDWARDKNTNEVWLRCKVRHKGQKPTDKADPALFRQVLRVECDGEEFAFLTSVIDQVRKAHPDAAREMSDAACLKLALEGKVEGLQVQAQFCPGCLDSGLHSRGEVVPITASTMEKFLCEGRVVGPDGKVLSRHLPADIQRAAMLRACGRCEVPHCRHQWFVNVHHLVLFSEGGTHALSNLVVLCGMHHILVHNGSIWIRGDREGGLEFTYADGTRIGDVPKQSLVEVMQTAFHALRDGGLPEGLVRAALEEVRDGHHRTVEAVLEAAGPVLARLAKQRRTSAEVAAEGDFRSHVGPMFTAAVVPEYATRSHVGRAVPMH